MTNSKTTKRALLGSSISLLLCFAMLLGTTFAWFTDSATVSGNKIQAGTLDIALEMWDGTKWVDAEGKTLNFISANGETDILWEPGCNYQLPKLRVVNKGNLAAKFQVQLTGIAGNAKLNEVIDWFFSYEAGTSMQRLKWSAFNNLNQTLAVVPAGETWGMNDDKLEFQFDGKMKTTAGNEYQGLSIDGVSITVVATQLTYEYDSKDNQYDKNAESPNVKVVSNDADLQAAIAAGETNIKLLSGEFNVDLYNIPAGNTLTINGSGSDTKLAFKNLQVRASQFKNLTISNCTIERMPDKAWGHLVFGSSTTPGGVYTISNCVFNGVGSQGIYINQDVAATFNIENCKFNGDFGSEGAITVQNNDGVDITVNVSGCEFSNIPTTSHEIFVHYAYDGWTLNAEGVNAFWKAK